MTDRLTHEEKIQLSEDAKRYLLPGSLLNMVFTRITKEALETFASTPLGDPKATAAHARMLAMNEIKSSLKAVVDDVKIQSRNLEKPILREPNSSAWNI